MTTTTGSAPSRVDAPRRDRTVGSLIFLRDRGIVVLWVLLVLVFAVWARPYFFTLTNAALVLNAAALTAIFAAAVGFGILSGALDLSVPGAAALASVVTGSLLVKGQPVVLCLVLGLVVGALVGYTNGLLVQRGLNPIVVTIATLTTTGGLANVVSGGVAVTSVDQLAWMGSATYAGIPAPVILVAVLYLVAWAWLTQTRAGSRLQAVGGNIEAVRRVGIRADRYRILGFVIGGICGALGGLAVTATTVQASPVSAVDLLFSAITAVALSGMPLTGGRGSLPRVLVGCLIIATINSALVIKGIQPYWTTVITGVLLVGALVFDKVVTRAVTNRLATTTDTSVHDDTGDVTTGATEATK